VDEQHLRLIRLGLDAAARHGFALGGGQAVQIHRFVARISDDVDLFTPYTRRGETEEAAARVTETYRAAGYAVAVEISSDTYVRMWVADPKTNPDADPDRGEATKVEMVANPRQHPPVMMDVGPVLHPDDVAAGKMSALYTRAAERDFIDVTALTAGGRYTREGLLRLAEADDAGFDRAMFAEQLGTIGRLRDKDFLYYGISAAQLAAARAEVADWIAELTVPECSRATGAGLHPE
jgi:hypothetical protein